MKLAKNCATMDKIVIWQRRLAFVAEVEVVEVEVRKKEEERLTISREERPTANLKIE